MNKQMKQMSGNEFQTRNISFLHLVLSFYTMYICILTNKQRKRIINIDCIAGYIYKCKCKCIHFVVVNVLVVLVSVHRFRSVDGCCACALLSQSFWTLDRLNIACSHFRTKSCGCNVNFFSINFFSL